MRSAHALVRFPYKTAHTDPKPMTMDPWHAAVVEARTIFPTTVRDRAGERILKSGHNSPKIGKVVVKGAWSGFPIFTLTLEERATCPTSCKEWRSCYGNRMPFAHRFEAGPDLEERIEGELAALQTKHSRGFVVRLHVLGDFYSRAYVDRWATWLDQFPALRVFGYTAWPETSLIGQSINGLRRRQWSRFAVRISNGDPKMGPAARTVDDRSAVRRDIQCPAQTGASLCCATCALCWAAPGKTIVFATH